MAKSTNDTPACVTVPISISLPLWTPSVIISRTDPRGGEEVASSSKNFPEAGTT